LLAGDWLAQWRLELFGREHAEADTMSLPLKPKDVVKALDVPDKPELEVCRAGIAGFQVKGIGRTYWWHDRGKTWSSADLDRQDEVKRKFQDAAGSGETK
jgi:hypothetical protein